MAYIVSLKEFDGPLDLLLTLISNAKIDIHDIFVSQITEQYLETMSLVDELDMDSASEFLQMAATLLEIKSRAMLPKPPKPEDPDELSPEEALIKQLEEYRQFKEVSSRMKQLEEEARALLTKLPEEYPLPPPNIEITGLTLDKLIKAYRKVLERAERAEADDRMASREIRRDSFTVSTTCLIFASVWMSFCAQESTSSKATATRSAMSLRALSSVSCALVSAPYFRRKRRACAAL